MFTRLNSLLVIVLVAAPSIALAQMSGSGMGNYSTTTLTQDMVDMPDGSSAVMSHYNAVIFDTAAKHPIHNTMSNCIGLIRLDANQKTTSGSGSCYVKDGKGNGASYWWRVDQVGTDSCPDICGAWGYFDGYGKFKGISGKGTWKREVLFDDGSAGSWTGEYSLP